MNKVNSNGKLLIFTAPSGAGKTTIVKHLLSTFESLAFSISATSRKKREHEEDGVDYYFKTPDEFEELIKSDSFVEWEEVYDKCLYGTLKKEVQRLLNSGKNVIFDIDVEGAINLKKTYQDRAFAVFVKPPSKDVLFKRLKRRKTESPESLKRRIGKATFELTFFDKFDAVLVNDDLQTALYEAEHIVKDFLKTETGTKRVTNVCTND